MIEVLSRVETRRTIIFFFIAFSLVALHVESVYAAETNVVNSVSVTASSGGSSSSSGQTSAGSSSGYVKVYTEINGEVVEDFEEHKSSSGGESVEIHYQKTVTATSSTSHASSAASGTEATNTAIIKTNVSGTAQGNATTATSLIKKMYGTGYQKVLEQASSSASTTSTGTTTKKQQSRWSSFWSGFGFYVRSFFFF